MTFFFIGGEDHDFTKVGNCVVDTATTAARRTANARCSLKVQSPSTNTDAWVASLSSSQSSFWLTARVYASASGGSSTELISFRDASGVRRVVIGNASAGTSTQIWTRNASGTVTTVATGGPVVPVSSITKVDVFINYASGGSIQVYFDGTLALSFSGNLTTDGVTSLSAVGFGVIQTTGQIYWSEVIIADVDTRFMDLITLAPAANGNTFNFDSGSASSINETTLDDATVITSGTAGQVAQFTVGSSGVTGSKAIKAVCISARAGKGATGPQNAKMNVRTGSADYSTSAIALQAGSVARIQGVFTTNPGTGNAWTNAELTAAGFNIGIVSDT